MRTVLRSFGSMVARLRALQTFVWTTGLSRFPTMGASRSHSWSPEHASPRVSPLPQHWKEIAMDTTEQPDATSEHEALGQRLRDAREFLGLSQEAVAAELKIPRASVSAMESGKRKVSSLELRDLARLYRTSVEILLGTEDFEPEQALDETQRALFRATRKLTNEERERVVQFARFLRTAGRAPAVPEESK
jgi:transcriptional regulator with XRE-family HTH domain